MKFYATYAGHLYSMVGGLVYQKNIYGKYVNVSVQLNNQQAGVVSVALTGYAVTTQKGNTLYQTTSGGYIDLKEGWTDKGTTYISQYTQTQAQALVNKIIANNKTIIQNNILCARFADKLTADEKIRLYDLQDRLQSRNTALANEGVTTNIQTSYPAGYAYLESYLDAFMATGGVGMSTAVIIVVSAVVIASLSTAAYFAYKSFADESAQDVKYSKELTATLTSKLTEEEYQQLLKETKGIVTKARIRQSLSSTSNVVMFGLAAAGGYFIYKFFKNKKKK